jgi:hypothetical protein
LTPGAASVPLAVSTANGLAAAIAAATFSGVRPPERTSGAVLRRSRASSQSKVAPVPPRSPGRCVSSMWKSVWKASSAATSAPERTAAAFMTLAPVRRATSEQKAGPSSPCSWTMVSPSASASSVTWASGALTKTPATSARRRSARAIRSASDGSQRRGEPGQRITPTAHAPAATASSASSSDVMPQILTRVTPQE